MSLELFPHQQNFIRTMISHPCARPWYVWIETFVPAFVELFITVNLFDIEDLLRSHGKQISAGGRKSGRGGRHAPKRRVSGFNPVKERYAQKALRTLLVVTQPLEFIGLAWLIYAATDRFFFNWQTLLEESDFCTQPIESGPLQLARGPGPVSIVASFIPVILNIDRQNRGGWPHSDLSAALPQGVFDSAFALTVKGPVGGVSNVKIRIRTDGAFGSDITESDPISVAQGEEGSMVVNHPFWYPLPGGGTITWEIGGETIPAGIETVKGHLYCMRTG